MIGSEEDELGVGEKINLKDILYESRFFIVNLLGLIGFGWIGYEFVTGIGNPAPAPLRRGDAHGLPVQLLLADVFRHRISPPLFFSSLL